MHFSVGYRDSKGGNKQGRARDLVFKIRLDQADPAQNQIGASPKPRDVNQNVFQSRILKSRLQDPRV